MGHRARRSGAVAIPWRTQKNLRRSFASLRAQTERLRLSPFDILRTLRDCFVTVFLAMT
jgi:hypothetical protein